MSRPRSEPSIESEPHLQGEAVEADPSEARAQTRLEAEALRTDPDRIEYTVWDEPTLDAALAGTPPPDQLTYARWLDERIAGTSWLQSWLVTFGLILVAGPWGVLGALFGGMDVGWGGLIAVVVFGPVTEEIAKVAAALWIVEKRPYLFKSIGQILLCAAAAGFLFGVVENLIYLNIYIPEADRALARWRWSVCTGLHTTCSFLAGVGLVRIWDDALRKRRRPRVGLGLPWIFTAMVGHGLYNLTVTIAQMTGWLKF